LQDGGGVMRQIEGYRLWIGNAGDARNIEHLLAAEIRAVVDLAIEEPAARLPRELIYLRVPLVDGLGNTTCGLALAVEVVESLLRKNVPTLVACGGGMSRAPAVAAKAVARIACISPDSSLQQLAGQGPHDVATDLWAQLQQLD
jgi:protein-tyrosine phosphatase